MRMMFERTSMRSNSGAGAQELAVLVLGAKAHDALDAGAVVPGAVEEHDLARGRQPLDVALEVPLGLLALGRLWPVPRYAHDAGVQPLGDALDDAALAGRIAALEDNHDLEAAGAHPLLQLDQLNVQPGEFLVVDRLVEPAFAFRRLSRGMDFERAPERRAGQVPGRGGRLRLFLVGHGIPPLQRLGRGLGGYFDNARGP